MKTSEKSDSGELVIGKYHTRHYDMCPAASDLYNKLLDSDVDTELLERMAKLHDVLFHMEKSILDTTKSPTKEDVFMAKNLYDQLMAMAKMIDKEKEHDYLKSHVKVIIDAYKNGKNMDEAAYEGNMGAMEMFKFYQIATDSEKKKMEDLIDNDKVKDAWRLVQQVTKMSLIGKEFGS